MTREEIHSRIQTLQQEQRKVLMESVFILNGEYAKIKDEIVALQQQCSHDFENGTCKYCFAKEG